MGGVEHVRVPRTAQDLLPAVAQRLAEDCVTVIVVQGSNGPCLAQCQTAVLYFGKSALTQLADLSVTNSIQVLSFDLNEGSNCGHARKVEVDSLLMRIL